MQQAFPFSNTVALVTETNLKTLRDSILWPDLQGITPWNYTLGGHGREMIDEIIMALPAKPVMLEIGCFLCASTRRWLELRNDLTVIGVDPWGDDLIDQCRRYVGRPALTRAYPDPAMQQKFVTDMERNGPFKTALANIQAFKSRFIPIRGLSPGALNQIKSAGVQIDLAYIDADKSAADLAAVHTLWPGARMTGDDWHWGRTKGYPMRQIIESFAFDKGFDIRAEHATWVLDPRC